MRTHLLLLGAAALVLSVAPLSVSAQHALSPGSTLGTPVDGPPESGGVSITQNTSLVVEMGGVACAQTGVGTVENGYWRVFILSDFPEIDDNFFSVESVDFGVSPAVVPAGGFGTELRIYQIDGGVDLSGTTFPFASATLVSSDDFMVEETATPAVYNVVIADSPDFAATDTIAVEWYTPDASTVGGDLRMGVNDDGETAPTYLWSPACGASDPTTVGSLGFPTSQWVVQINGQPIPVDSEVGPEQLGAALGQSVPNPAADGAAIPFTMREQADVRLAIYDVLGREVAVLVDQTLAAGSHTASLDTAALPSGTYVYRLQSGSTVQQRTLTITR